jgi:hypothetical protein
MRAADRAAALAGPERVVAPRPSLANPDLPGSRLVGRVYGTVPDGRVHSCSATLVASANHSVVWTAGHCVHGGRHSGYYSKLVFAPGLRADGSPGGMAPYGLWPAVRWATTEAWARVGDQTHFRRDFGVLVVGRDPAGRTITDVLGGAQAISFAPAVPRKVTVLGYPFAPASAENNALWTCPRRSVRGRYRAVRGLGPNPLVATCGMAVGASGGPWLTNIDANGIGVVRSVTSAAFVGQTSLGPVQDRVAKRLFLSMQAVPV